MQEVESAYMRRKAAVKGDSCRVTGGDGKSLETLFLETRTAAKQSMRAVEPEYIGLVEIGGLEPPTSALRTPRSPS